MQSTQIFENRCRHDQPGASTAGRESLYHVLDQGWRCIRWEHGYHGYLRINEMKGRLYHIDSGMLADVDAQASESISVGGT